MRYQEFTKEIYEVVKLYEEYNRINPYVRVKNMILAKYPKAKIKRFKTDYIWLPNQPNEYKFVPYLKVWFETGE